MKGDEGRHHSPPTAGVRLTSSNHEPLLLFTAARARTAPRSVLMRRVLREHLRDIYTSNPTVRAALCWPSSFFYPSVLLRG